MPLDAVVDVPGLCPPPEPYSYAVRAGDTLYLAGQVALDADGEVVGTTVGEQARQVWANIASVLAASGRLDALLTPTLPATAPPKGVDDLCFGPSTEPVVLAYVRTTGPFNLSGLPALSVPAGFDRDGLPIGLQIAAVPFDEEMALRVGACFESAAGVSGPQAPTSSVGAAADAGEPVPAS